MINSNIGFILHRLATIHKLRTLAHNRCKWHSAENRHAVGEDESADENCICVNKRSILKKVKVSDNENFTENSGIYLFVHMYAAQCVGVFRFCYIEVIQRRGTDYAS